MLKSFNHILTIFFNHRFFSDNQLKSISIKYERDTLQKIRNLDIIMKFFPGGAHLLATNPELLDTKNETEPIRLMLNSNDSLFFNYTELPSYQPSHNLLYFNNLNVKLPTKGNRFPLHKNDFVAQNEVVPVSNGQLIIPGYDEKNKYVFTDAKGNEIGTQFIRQSQPGSDNFFLSNISDGLVRIKENNKEVAKFYCYTNAVWRKPLGIVEIYPGMLYKHFKEKGKLEYVINFNNRETVWKYFLVDPVYEKFKNLSIINKSKEEVFKNPEKELINDNKEALVFESKKKIPISEYSNDTFQLVDDYDPKLKPGKIILRKLPNASPDILYNDEANPAETIYSHIFI